MRKEFPRHFHRNQTAAEMMNHFNGFLCLLSAECWGRASFNFSPLTLANQTGMRLSWNSTWPKKKKMLRKIKILAIHFQPLYIVSIAFIGNRLESKRKPQNPKLFDGIASAEKKSQTFINARFVVLFAEQYHAGIVKCVKKRKTNSKFRLVLQIWNAFGCELTPFAAARLLARPISPTIDAIKPFDKPLRHTQIENKRSPRPCTMVHIGCVRRKLSIFLHYKTMINTT